MIAKTTKGRWSTLYYENSAGEIVSKRCTKCEVVKNLDEFYVFNTGIGGRMCSCIACQAQYRDANRARRREVGREYYKANKEQVTARIRKYRENNPDKVAGFRYKWREENPERDLANSRKWRAENKEKILELQRQWRRNNPDKVAINDQKRRARKEALPDTLTSEQYQQTLEYFGNSCALSGNTFRVEVDHAIPLASGYGGTTFENCYPLTKSLNSSKNDRNMFDWFRENKDQLSLDQGRFDKLISYLADVNEMTADEYREYYFSCF